MKGWFLARDYRENVVDEQISKVIFRHSFFSDTNIYFRLCIVIKIKKSFKSSKNLLAFSNGLIQKRQKIKDYIVRSRFYQLERNVGCGGCWNGRCQVCKDIKVTDTFYSFTIKKSYKINHKLYKGLDLLLQLQNMW